MIRFLLRFLGLWVLAAAFLWLVIDGTKSIAGNAVSFTQLGKTWYDLSPNSLQLLQPAIERRHLARGAAVDPHELRVHGKPPTAASSPRALARVSSSSRSGSESATMPAPARKLSCRAESVIERMRMLRSSRPSRVR